MTQANQADFFGEGTADAPTAAGAMSPDELERQRLALRQRQLSDQATQIANTNNAPGTDYTSGRTVMNSNAIDPKTGRPYVAGARPDPGSFWSGIGPTLKAISRDPVTMGVLAAPYGVLAAGAAAGGLAAGGVGSIATPAGQAAIYGAPAGLSAASAPFTMASPLAAGAGSTLAGAAGAGAATAGGLTTGQAIGGALGAAAIGKGLIGSATASKVNAPQVGANFAGSAAPGGGGGGGGGPNGGASQGVGQIADLRDQAAQDMFAYGDSAQSRAAPQTNGVTYRPTSQVNAPKLAPAAQAQMGSYGAQQTVNAPTLAPAAQAQAGGYGGPQTIQAQQAGTAQAQNQAGFLAGTAQSARNVADLDFGQSNESRGAQQQNLAGIQGFLDNGPGPSMAQQQLRMGQEQNLGDALSLAHSGRGNASGNMKMAVSENAATNAQTNQQASLLRAQEADMWQSRQLQGLGLQQQGAGAMRGQDLGAAQAQGQQALSREQLAGNIDVSRAGLEQGLSQFNAGQANTVGMSNAQLGTEAGIQQAGLANALNIAQGNANTNVNLQNAQESNLTNRLQGQMGLDASSQTAQLANALNIAQGNAGTNVNLQNAEQSNLTNRLQGQMGLEASSTNATLGNALNIAQGNSDTSIEQSNLQAKLDQGRANDAFTNNMYGYGMGAYDQQLAATRAGMDDQYRYRDLAAEIAMRDADRAAGIATGNADRSQRRDAAYVGAGGAVLASVV